VDPFEDDKPAPWVGRAPARPRADPTPTTEFPVVRDLSAEPTTVVYVQTSGRRWTVVVGLMLLCFAAGITVAMLTSPALRGAVGLGPDSPDDPAPTVTQSPTPAPPGIGNPVRDGAIELVVTGVDCDQKKVGRGLFTRHAAGRYCLVDFALRNTGSGLLFLSANDQWVVTTDGTRHNADLDATMVVNNSLLAAFAPVGPGDSMTGTLVFDIPDEATIATIELHEGSGTEGAIVTL
jgi:hypothetical protein